MEVNLLYPCSESANLEILVERLNQFTPLMPFSDEVIDYLSALSKKILSSQQIKKYPELVALGYWLRKSNLNLIKTEFEKNKSGSQISTARGIAFHIAPSNVDTIFLYSWALSLLAGNMNIVRISSESNSQLDYLLEIKRELLSDSRWKLLADRNFIIRYPRNEEINGVLSENADVRLIWGGDYTVKNMRKLPSKPGTKDILFADKYSYSVINSEYYLNSTAKDKENLAAAFFNDAYWFNQMACSSPKIIYYTGAADDCQKASLLFRANLKKVIQEKNYLDNAAVSMDKLVFMYETLSRSKGMEILGEDEFYTLRIPAEEISDFRNTCGGGMFFECFLGSLDELLPLINANDQTLGYYGFSKEELKEFALKTMGKGVNRIVPIGEALKFSPIWDGYNIMSELTKLILIN